MIEYLVLKNYLTDRPLGSRTISLSFRGINEFSDEDIKIIKKLMNKAPQAMFIFSRLQENLIEDLKEKINKEDLKRIFFVHKN
jgi:nitrogen regulatory protein PII-like uncharacterized protein